ncbi:MAG: hypothetical protein FJW26_08985 [Acidimicrobiia bacterium]|nr:hypothetical protein [Acidimicrobiia bacterium]
MRRALGSICYVVGGAGIVLVLQLLIRCELMAAFSEVENNRYDLWSFLFITDGHHLAYPNGYLVHALRDALVTVGAVVIVAFGRRQFLYRKKRQADKIELVACPGCHKKTYADAYCRFCGYNLVTHMPASASFGLPFWKLSLLAYGGVSVVLLIVNLLLSR